MSIQTSDLPLHDRINTELEKPFMRKAIANAQDLLNQKREDVFKELGNYEQWKSQASAIRHHVLENLDYYLDLFSSNAEQAGAHVYFASTDQEATERALAICQAKNASKVVKSKSMVTEEIGLNEVLEDQGIEVIETDLGEYLLQIDNHDKPSHIVVPALHKNRDRIQQVLQEKRGYDGDNLPENMTRFVRHLIRKDFLEADVAITGCNFGVAETGTCTLVTNEGNGRFVTTVPKTQIVVMGMERLVPSFKELDTMLSLLARSAVGAKLTSYMTLFTGPKKPDDMDGPEELHIIIVDNGRSKVLGSPFKEVLKCIRCGTCMLECPAYRHVCGHGYGALYPGPLGAALVPVLAGYTPFKDLTKICTLCGACNEVCPVQVPLYEYIYEHRRIIAEEKQLEGRLEGIAMGLYGGIIGNAKLYDMTTRFASVANISPKIGPLKQWCKNRERPHVATQRFRDWYKITKKGQK
ncbi:LutB/LldF family L-lactate oxidation iron-sulfur protein [Desulfogranum marinum]|uniref:LutB/LldF family L-lactate oxidation iron-sulfur protein n=1 Tax=Desulfogranum marinum TaxID=453220 RepID=UPI001964E929|nr:LutB/LldF family L-lactate oxidation iron-sulfur protein [Desulfogranum marinum]MBM9513331.1 iron-sulfur cluster-binding protein [Desulfogranum marinum]